MHFCHAVSTIEEDYSVSHFVLKVMPLGPTVLSVPCDESGLKTDDLSRMLDQYTGKKIKVHELLRFVYCTNNSFIKFNNKEVFNSK